MRLLSLATHHTNARRIVIRNYFDRYQNTPPKKLIQRWVSSTVGVTTTALKNRALLAVAFPSTSLLTILYLADVFSTDDPTSTIKEGQEQQQPSHGLQTMATSASQKKKSSSTPQPPQPPNA